MSSGFRPIAIQIDAEVTGMKDIEELARDLEDMAKVANDDLAVAAKAAAAQLRAMAQQDAAITAFTKLQGEASAAGNALSVAEQEAASYAGQIARLGPPTAQEAEALRRLDVAADGARVAFSRQNAALAAAQAELQGYGISAKHAGDVQQRLRQEVEQVREAVSGLVPAYKSTATVATSAGSSMSNTHQQMGRDVQSIRQQLEGVQRIYAAFLSLQGAKAIAVDLAKTADEAKNLQARLSLVTGEGENLKTAWAGITDVALRTHSALEETGALMGRITQVGKEAGLSTQQAVQQSLSLTETINQAIQIGGASADASKAAITQLIQGLQSGILRGDEFNSIMEQSPRLAKALADGLSVTTGELRKMAEAGLLTSNTVMRALQGQSAKVAEEFDKLPPTVGRALQDLSTQWMLYVADTDKATGASTKAATAIGALSSNLRTIAGLFIDLGQATAAFVALRLAQQFLGISTAAQASAAAVAATNVQLNATGAAAATAAAGTGRLASMLGTLRTFTLVGLIANFKDIGTWIGESAAKLAGYKDRTLELEAAERAAAQAAKEAAAARAAQAAAMQEAIDKQFDLSKAARSASAEFVELTKNSSTAADALRKVTDGFDLSKLQGIKDFAATLDKLGADGAIAASEFQAAWAKALDGKDLAQFEVSARAAFMGTSREAERLAQMTDGVLREAVRRTGLEYGVLQGRSGAAARSAINDVEAIIASLARLKADGIDTGQVLAVSLSKAIQTADTQKALEAVREQVERVRNVLGDKVADGLLAQAADQAKNLKEKIEGALPGIQSVEEAMKRLGITSDATLKETADKFKQSYDYMAESGKNTARELQEAFRVAAEAAISANNGVAPAWVKAQAVLRGYEVAVDDAGKSTLRLKDATEKSSDSHGRNAGAIDDNRTALERLNAEREREIAAQEKANELKERELQLYREKWNIDKEGFSKNMAGNRIQAFAHTRASVFNQAKEAGLSDAEALRIADSFGADSDYGKNASVSKVNDAINASKIQTARDSVNTANNAAKQQTTGTAASTSSSGITHVVNITLPSGGKYSIGTDGTGASGLTGMTSDFLKELQAAQRVSQ